MRTRRQKTSVGIGFTMLILMAGINDINGIKGLVFIILWMIVAVWLLFIGKAFSFQRKRHVKIRPYDTYNR